ncbi:hypothetical protein CO661_26970, partial [Sinorhizobium fredii]
QADPFPAPSGKHGDRRSYTTPWDMITVFNKNSDLWLRQTIDRALSSGSIWEVHDANQMAGVGAQTFRPSATN